MIANLALALLIPAALLTWRWSRLVSVALGLTFAVWLAYRGIRWQWPEVWEAGKIEWMRGVSMLTGGMGAVELALRARRRSRVVASYRNAEAWAAEAGLRGAEVWAGLMQAGVRRMRWSRPDLLAALLVASMAIDLTAWLIHRGAGQWGPQPFFQVVVLLAMCVIGAWPRRKS